MPTAFAAFGGRAFLSAPAPSAILAFGPPSSGALTVPILKRIGRYGPKFVFRYPEALRLAGTFHWLAGRQRTAVARWKEGLAIARRLDLRPELGRISFEIAKRLSSSESRIKAVDGLRAEAFAQTARKRFAEIGLGVDLKEVDDWERSRAAPL